MGRSTEHCHGNTSEPQGTVRVWFVPHSMPKAHTVALHYDYTHSFYHQSGDLFWSSELRTCIRFIRHSFRSIIYKRTGHRPGYTLLKCIRDNHEKAETQMSIQACGRPNLQTPYRRQNDIRVEIPHFH